MLACGAVQGAARMSRLLRVPPGAGGGALAASAAASWLAFSPGPLGGLHQPARFAPYERAPLIREAASMVPSEASLMAQTDLAPHFSRRRTLWMFPDSPQWGIADYVLLDLAGSKYPLTDPEEDYDRAITEYQLNPGYEVVYDRDFIQLIRKRPPLAPPVRLEVAYARRVALDGITVALPPQPGGEAVITLWWRSVAKTTENFLYELEALGPDGRTVARMQGHLLEDWFPTSFWEPGRAFMVPARLTIPSASPATLRLRLTIRGESNGRVYAPDSAPEDSQPIIWPRP
jgi:hypothetical protein